MDWTTGDGVKIKYCDLDDSHFMNIIADGYRNKFLLEEATRRGILVPPRSVDTMSEEELDKAEKAMVYMVASLYNYTENEQKLALQHIRRLRKLDYACYLLVLSRALDGRDESLRS